MTLHLTFDPFMLNVKPYLIKVSTFLIFLDASVVVPLEKHVPGWHLLRVCREKRRENSMRTKIEIGQTS